MTIMFDIEAKPLVTASGDAITSHKSLFRTDTNQCLGVVGKDYKPVMNAEVFEAVEAQLNRLLSSDQREGGYVKDSLSYAGAWTKREYIFPALGGTVTSKGTESKIGYRTIVTNSYNGTSSVGLITGLIDFYCTNGMVVGDFVGSTKRRHSTGFNMTRILPTLEESLENMDAHIKTIERWTDVEVADVDVQHFLERQFSARRADQLMGRFYTEAEERGKNVWALYSAMTFFSSHVSDEFPVRDTGSDNASVVLHYREAEVTKAVNSNDWKELAA